MPDPVPGSRESERGLLARHLAGAGLELGPGHAPFPVPYPGVTVRYVDRWQPDENRALFQELGDEAAFPKPDIVANLDTDGLKSVDDETQDFVIASHVFEHMANPLALLVDVHRVLRPGGTLLLLLPDRHRTFDRDRRSTPLAHLVEEHDRGVHDVDDDHVADFLVGTGVPVPEDPAERAAVFDLHRRRSIHVHCWDEVEFFEVLVHAVTEMGHRWELVDAVLSDDEGVDGFEFGYVLRRSLALDDAAVLAERLRLSWRRWYEHRRWWHAHLEALRTLGTAEAPSAVNGSAPAAQAAPPGPLAEEPSVRSGHGLPGDAPLGESVRRVVGGVGSLAVDMGVAGRSLLRAIDRRRPRPGGR
jgi:SAM-dependent methyltransferase